MRTRLGTFFIIRHKASKCLMPQARRNRGYSHWNPSGDHAFDAALGVPRLLTSRKSAELCIAQWAATPNGRYAESQGYDGEYDGFVDSKPDGRAKGDLEIVEVNLDAKKVV